jgi:hypothetical protein
MKNAKNNDVFSKKLKLHRETLRRLDAGELRKIQGGAHGDQENSYIQACTGDTNGTVI